VSKYNKDTVPVVTVVEGDKMHYQTEPFVGDDGKVHIHRLGTVDLEIHNVETARDMARDIRILDEGGDPF